MEEYISGERHKELTNHAKNNLTKPILIAVVGVLVIAASFYGGIAYQKTKQPKIAASNGQFSTNGGPQGMSFPGGGNRMMGAAPSIGTVTAISDTSITYTTTDTNESKTLTVASTTSIMDSNNQKAAASTIKAGDKVLVIANQNDATVADRISINPQSMSGESGGATTVSQ
ncbi:MAG: hypothetical protein AAB436_01690 [Patescibacteria group bacterium]